VTNFNVPVSNGLFSVTLNFGPGVFNGTDNGSNDWLDIAVRATGATAFTPLTPRQPILPVPYALFAVSASNLLGNLQATQVVGTISSTLISGNYSNSVNFVNPTNTFAGSFSGNGVGLTNLNASNISSGTLNNARLPSDVALLGQNQTFTGVNSFTASNSFSGLGSYSGINNFTNNGNSFYGSFFGNGLIGFLPVYGNTTNAMRDSGYLMLSSNLSTVILPATASLSVVDMVRVTGGGTGGWLVRGTNGQSIIGNFAAYRSSFVTTLLSGNNYSAVASSADGVQRYAVGPGFTGVAASSDGGHTWGQVPGTISGFYTSIACSANGKIIFVLPSGGGTISMSTNGGATWFSAGVSGASGTSVASTADGSKFFYGANYACSGNGTYLGLLSSGSIYYSTNSGTSFINIPSPVTSVAVSCLAVSSDCTKLVAGVNGGLLYASSNLGATWTTLSSSNQVWSGAWMSPDGSKLAAAVSTSGSIPGGVYSCNVSVLPNTSSTNSIGGSQGSSVELQYIGNNQFMPVSSAGLLWSN
jgi:hypothetical protein